MTPGTTLALSWERHKGNLAPCHSSDGSLLLPPSPALNKATPDKLIDNSTGTGGPRAPPASRRHEETTSRRVINAGIRKGRRGIDMTPLAQDRAQTFALQVGLGNVT